MTRKKVKLVWIANNTARKASFKKRRLGFMKKVRELTTLCGIHAFAVVYGPDDRSPVIWPSLSAAQHLYRRFQSLPLVERQKKMSNQETYLKERTVKAQDQLKKAIKKNQALEIDILMNQLQMGRPISEFSTPDLLALLLMIEHRMRECRKRIEYHQQVHRLQPAPAFLSSNAPVLQTRGNDTDPAVDHGRSLVDQWFMDMVTDDQIRGTACGMAAPNLDGLINGGLNPMTMEIGGTFTAEEDNLLSQWNFDRTGSSGIDENAYPVDLTHGGGGGGNGDMGASDEAEMLLLDELFGNGSSSQKIMNENEDVFLNKEWANNITPP